MDTFFKHDSAYVDDGAQIGAGTKIWHFSHIMGGAVIGERCVFGQNVNVDGGVVIGNNVKVQNNVSIYTGTEIEDDVFLGPSCVLTNVTNPRSQVNRHSLYEKTLIRRGATIGANATIVCGVTLGRYCFIGAGAVVTKDVPDYALMLGNPARHCGWMSRHGHRLSSKVLKCESAEVNGGEGSKVRECGSAEVNGGESSKVLKCESAKVSVGESSKVRECESAKVNGGESSKVRECESAEVNGGESSKVLKCESAKVNGGESSKVRECGSSKVSGGESSKVLKCESARVIDHSPGTIFVCPESGYRYELRATSEDKHTLELPNFRTLELHCLDLNEESPLPTDLAKGITGYREFKVDGAEG